MEVKFLFLNFWNNQYLDLQGAPLSIFLWIQFTNLELWIQAFETNFIEEEFVHMYYYLVPSLFGSDVLSWWRISLSCGIKSCFIVRVGARAGITVTIQQESQVPAHSEFVNFFCEQFFCLSVGKNGPDSGPCQKIQSLCCL